MQPSTEERTKATQQLYRRHHDAEVQEEVHFSVGQLVYVDYPLLLTFIGEKVAGEANSKMLLRGLRPYRVMKTTLHTIIIDKKRVMNMTSAGLELLALAHMQPQEVVEDEYSPSILETSVRNRGIRNDQPG